MNDVADGDRRAFDELHRRTKTKLFKIAFGICRDHADAEDVMADVYLSVWKRAGSYQACQGSPISWLAAVTRNRAIDRLRMRKPSDLPYTIDSEQICDPSLSAADSIIVAQTRDALQQCLKRLPLATRAAIHDAFFEGLTHTQLASREGIPLGTMKSIIRRGLLSLRRSLSE